jgi:hypothetical protein
MDNKIRRYAAKVHFQRLLLIKSNIQKCYVAADDNNTPFDVDQQDTTS